jgi:hypothetical protein
VVTAELDDYLQRNYKYKDGDADFVDVSVEKARVSFVGL